MATRGRSGRLLAWVLLFPLLGIPEAGRAADLGFSEALDALHRKNETLLAAAMEERRYEAELAAARGLLLPRIEMISTYTRMEEPIKVDMEEIRQDLLNLKLFGLIPILPPGALPSLDLMLQDDEFVVALLSATWPIFTGGRILAANQAARARLEEARENTRFTDSNLTSELARRYFGLCLALQVREVKRQVLQAMNEHFFQARRLQEEGMIALAERLHADVARAQADWELKSAERDVKIVQSALSNLLALDEPVTPTSPLFLARVDEPLQEFLRLAADRNPGLKQLAAKQDQAHQAYRAEVGRWFPEVFLFGTQQVYEHHLSDLAPEWIAGVGARLSLFEGGSRWHQMQAAQRVEERVNSLRRKASRDIESLVEKRYNELMKALEQFEALEASLALAEENLRVRKRGFEEGLATSLDVVDAQLTLSGVHVKRLVAAFDFDVALAELLEASGQSEKFEDYRSRAYLEIRS